MTEATSNLVFALVAIFGVVIAVAGAIGNIIAFLVTRLELRAQRQETRELAKLTSDLDHRIHRLAVHLDYEKQRLERVRDLITGLMHVTHALRQDNRPNSEKMDIAVKLNMTMPELEALVNTIEDGYLQALFVQLKSIFVDEIWPRTWNEMEYDHQMVDELLSQQSRCTKQMHQRLLELIETTTRIEEKA